MFQVRQIEGTESIVGLSGVVWITGFSGAGKTTVARKVKTLLQERGFPVVFLDGDDLRRIFSEKWGYERTERIELAHAYFRLCNTLAAQGVTVVIAAVAMYDEIYAWVRENIDRSFQVYLRVPELERQSRDSVTKKLYGSIGDTSKLYDEPALSDLVIENYGGISPEAAAHQIVEAYESRRLSASDKGRSGHWDQYYKQGQPLQEPSSFATAVVELLRSRSLDILEIGCGNGRDALYLASLGNRVTAIDPSIAAIDLCKTRHTTSLIQFANCTLPELPVSDSAYDVVYSRFCLHAMTEIEELDTLRAAHRVLRPHGSLFIECRSINDPLSRKGEVISPTERIFGHYRRFIVPDELKNRLERLGFTIRTSQESAGLAIHGDDNPVVLRVHAFK